MNRLISLCVVGLLASLPLATVEPSATAQEQSAIAEEMPELFGDGLRPAEMRVAAGPTVVRSRTVRINIDLLNSIKANDRFVFNLFEDATFTAVLESTETRDTWVGSIKGKPAGTFTLVMNDGALSAIIRVPGKGIYRVRSLRDGVVVIQEIDETRFPPCGIGPAQGVMAGGGAAAGAGCDDGSVIDVLVVYTLLARDAAGGTAAIEAEIDLAFANTNTAYDNSLIAPQLNLVHVEEIAYDEVGDYVDHLYRLTDPADGYMDNVHDLRDQYGADMVALFVAASGSCGIAWLMQELSPAFEQYAFSVTKWSCAAGNLTFAHELGHNQGSHHDRANAGSDPVFDYSYGYQDPGELFRTVMAYNCPGGCPRIQHFSNPDVLYQGLPTGVPIDQPDSAHNALTINQTALTVANFRCAVGPFIELAKITAPDGEAGDFFGYSVAVDGDTALIGAHWDDHAAGTDAGSAYVFRFDGSTWLFEQKLLADDGAPDDYFGSSVFISGNTAVVGAVGDDHGRGWYTGSAYVFLRSGKTWSQQAKLTASDAAVDDRFGRSVSISGDTVVVGARLDDNGGSVDAGSAYVFVRSGATWSQEAKLTAADGAAGDQFGRSVCISSETLVVAASHDDHTGGTDAGSAYIFVREPGASTWSQQAKLTAADAEAGDEFGRSVSISGGTIVVGTPWKDNFAGSAYVFVGSGMTWSQQAKLTASDAATGDNFGYSVSISGETLVGGAQGDDHSGVTGAGSAYVFVRTGMTWSQLAKLTASDAATGDFFGVSVSISGNIAVVGAWRDDINPPDAGSGYVFSGRGSGVPPCPADLDGDGSVGASDLLALLVSWGPCKGCPADFDGDGNVGASDLLALLVNWGPCP